MDDFVNITPMMDLIQKLNNATEAYDRGEPYMSDREWDDLYFQLEKMEDERIICGYHTLIDWDKVGVEKVSALIEVRVTPQKGMGFDHVAERIYNYPEVNSVYLISGGFDFMVTLEGKSLREIAQFVSEKLAGLDQVISTKTNFILKKYKDHGTVMAVHTKDERVMM